MLQGARHSLISALTQPRNIAEKEGGMGVRLGPKSPGQSGLENTNDYVLAHGHLGTNWTVPETLLCAGQLNLKGNFWAFEEQPLR